jgi:uncharacterized protein (DUF342 family)
VRRFAAAEPPLTHEDGVDFRVSPGRRQPLNVIHEERSASAWHRISATQNGLYAFLEWLTERPDGLPTTDRLRELLSEAGIRAGVDPEALAMIVELLSGGVQRVGPLQVAAGSPPSDGQDGYLQFHVTPSSQRARYTTDESGKIDYHQTNLIENAHAGQAIAELHPPGRGEPGESIFGEPIPPSAGSPLSLRLGSHVRFDEYGVRCIAEIDGRVIWENDTLSMSDEFEVDGDIDLSVGDIDFVGHVTVHGQVLDEFFVAGRKGVRIQGVVGAASVESDGDIELPGGIAGKDRGRIRTTAGAITARYLNSVRVESAGDIGVRKEILHSSVRTRGRLAIPDGSIIGGEVIALRGVEAHTIGSPLGVNTRITTGVDFQAADRISAVADEGRKLEDRIDRLVDALGPLGTNHALLHQLSTEGRGLVRDVLQELRTLDARRAEVEREREQLGSDRPPGAIMQINVLRQIHPGTVIYLGETVARISQALTGPLSLLLSSSGDAHRVAAYTPLPEDPPEAPQNDR